MKAVIFGARGQDGRLLSALIGRCGGEVIGVSRKQGPVQGDVADTGFVEAILQKHAPEFVFHFAAVSSTHHSNMYENHRAIGTGTLNILESALRHCPHAKIFLSGSARQFQNDGNPINEQSPFEASSSYSLARIHSTYAGRYYRSAFGMQVYCGFLFHHDSPLRTEQHVNQKIACAVSRIAGGSGEMLQLGDVNVEKEFNYAGDIVDAIWLLVNQDNVFEVVMGCGEVHSIREWVEYCFKKIGKNWEDYVTIQSGHQEKSRKLISDPSKLQALGWQPKVSFQQLADMMLVDHDSSV